MPATIHRSTPGFATANVAAYSVREGFCGITGIVGGGLIGRSDPGAEPDLVSAVNHVIRAKRVDMRDIGPVFCVFGFSFLHIGTS